MAEEKLENVCENILTMIVGSTGAGKDTVIKSVMQKLGTEIIQCFPSCTTRAPREKEVNGVDYIFYSMEEMKSQCQQGKMVEVKKVYGNIYGTHIDSINKALQSAKIAVNDYDVQGYLNAKKRITYVREKNNLPPLPIVTILIDAPDKVLIERVMKRKDNTDLNGRIKQLEQDRIIKRYSKYDYTVINDDLETCVEAVCNIIKNEYEKNTGKPLIEDVKNNIISSQVEQTKNLETL